MGQWFSNMGGTVKQDDKHIGNHELSGFAETGVFRFVYMATLRVSCFQVVPLLWARWLAAAASC